MYFFSLIAISIFPSAYFTCSMHACSTNLCGATLKLDLETAASAECSGTAIDCFVSVGTYSANAVKSFLPPFFPDSFTKIKDIY